MRKVCILLVVFLLISLVGGFACKPKPAAKPTPEAPAPASAPAPTVASLAYYENNTFGFKLGYPKDWEAKETGDFSPVVSIKPPTQDLPQMRVLMTYGAEVLSPDKVADGIIADILTLPGAKVVTEEKVELEGKAPAFEVIYSLGRGETEQRGILLVATRGSQGLIVSLMSTQAQFEEKSSDFLNYVHSLQLEEPRPFGISRQESLTLFYPEPLTLDPAQVTEVRSVQYITQIFSGLMAFTPTLELIPDLAEKYEVSPDGKIYTFYLRANARFHDGKRVTAGDFKYSWERAARSGSPTVSTYLGDVIGVKEVVAGKATEIRGVEVVDERKLRVTIDAPKVYFLAKLTHPVAFVVDRANVEGKGEEWWREPNGTGPYRLKGWQRQIVMALERNSDYHRTKAQIPYIVFRHLGVSPLRMYETGEVDVAFPGIEEVEEILKPDNPLAKELEEVAQLSISYVGFNTKKPPFDNAAIRRSFLLAIDRERLIKEIHKEKVPIAHGFLPPGLPAYNPKLTPIPFNPEEARRLLASYGNDLPRIIFVSAGYTTVSPLIEALINMWRENLGVRVEIKLLEPDQYYYQLETKLENLYDYGWIADYPDPENFLDVLFHSGTANNIGKYANNEVDQLLEQARVEGDSKIRFRLYQEAEEILRQGAVAIPLSFGREFVLVKPFIKEFIVNPQGLVDLRLVSLTSR